MITTILAYKMQVWIVSSSINFDFDNHRLKAFEKGQKRMNLG